MSLKTNIIGNSDSYTVDVVKNDCFNLNTLVVSTDELKQFNRKVVPFSSFTYGSNLNQDFTGGISVTENVHNGNDNTYWTGSSIVGDEVDFSNDRYSYTGDQSIKCKGDNGDVFQLYKGSIIQKDDFDSLNIWIYIDKNWGATDNCQIYLYNTINGTQSSQYSINIGDYINYQNTDIWQNFSLPINDFGTINNTYDSLRFRIINNEGKKPEFYIDDIKFYALSDPQSEEFKITPTKGKWWYVYGFQFTFAIEYDSTLLSSTMPKIPYDSLFGINLTNGILYQRTQDKQITFNVSINSMLDIIEQPGISIVGNGYDGTNTWLTLKGNWSDCPLLLKWETEDELKFICNDDLSSFKRFRIYAEIKEFDCNDIKI